MELEAAKKATRQGAVAALVSAGLMLLLMIGAMFLAPSGVLEEWADPFMLLDVGLLAVLAIGVLRHSRAAAVALVVYFVVSKIVMWVEAGKPAGLGVSLIFLFFFGRAVQGAFAYHAIRRREDPDYVAPKKWPLLIGVPVVVAGLALVGLGLLAQLQVVPSVSVVTGAEMRTAHRDRLLEEGILLPGETVRLFYSNGLLSILEDGNMLTDQRVVSYMQNENGLEIHHAALERIIQIDLIEPGTFSTPSIVEVWSEDGSGFVLFLPHEEGADMKFMDAIRSGMEERAGHVVQPVSSEGGQMPVR